MLEYVSVFSIGGNEKNEPEVYRFHISRKLQEEIAGHLDDSYQEFCKREVRPFDPGYKPGQDERFEMEFGVPDLIKAAIETPADVASVADGNLPKGTRAVMVVDSKAKVGIAQTAEDFLISRGKKLFFWSSSKEEFEPIDAATLSISKAIHLVFDVGRKQVSFSSLYTARRIIDLDTYVAEATLEDVSRFVNKSNLISTSTNVTAMHTMLDSHMRRKLNLILKNEVRLAGLTVKSIQQVAASHAEGRINIQTDAEGRIVLPSAKSELKELLALLDDDYLTSPLTATPYQSNSKRIVGPGSK